MSYAAKHLGSLLVDYTITLYFEPFSDNLSVPWGPGTFTYKHQVKTTTLASRLGGSSGAAMFSRGSDSHLSARGNSRATTCPRGSSPRLPAGGSSGPPHVTWASTLTFWLKVAPELPRVPRIDFTGCKQINKYLLMIRPSWSPSGHVCAYLLRHCDKGCSTRSQDVHEAVH
jgi:hypothetical protein